MPHGKAKERMKAFNESRNNITDDGVRAERASHSAKLTDLLDCKPSERVGDSSTCSRKTWRA
jgi:hypothetical protein